MFIKLTRALTVITGLTFSAFPAFASDTVTIGDSSKPGDLTQALDDAYQKGARDITIAPGNYEIPVKDHDSIVLDHWKDATIHANGVTLIFDRGGYGPLTLYHCNNVVWDGGTIGFSKPGATQGRITAIGSDSGGAYCDWQVDAGYSDNVNPVKSCYNVVDATTRVLRVDTGDWTPSSFTKLDKTGAFRLYYRDKPRFQVNDWLVTRAPNGNMTSHLDGCEKCTLENMTFFNGGFASFFETDGEGGNHYLKCKIITGPRPTGAVEDQIVSSGADGFHSVGTTTGPDIEDCIFTGVFLDDCIAIHGAFGRVVAADGKTITLKDFRGSPVVGEPLRISDTHGFFGQALVTAIQKTPSGDAEVTLDQDLHVPVDHSQDNDEKLGTKASNPLHCGRGYKILRCRLGDTRSRGILVKADDGLIQGNTIEGCGMTGVSIGPEFWWGEANYSWNVTVDHNTFHNCNKTNGEQATILVHEDGAIGNGNIFLKYNLMDTCYGCCIFRIEGANCVLIEGNEIRNSFTVDPRSPGNVIRIKQSMNVLLNKNLVRAQGSFANEIVALDKSVSPSDVKNVNGIVASP